MFAVLTWAIAAGPVFQAAPTDRSVKGAAAVIVLVTLADLAIRSRREHVHKAVEIREWHHAHSNSAPQDHS